MSSVDVTCASKEKSGIKITVSRRRDLVYLALSLFTTLLIFINSSMLDSLFIGCFASVVYILINGNLLGHTFFEESDLKLPLGMLFLVALLGIAGWPFVIFARLTIREVTIALCIASFVSFALKKHAEIRVMVAKMKQYLGKILA
ncbi:MAG: hypothetical protein ACFFBS_08645 [Promethearchaeota archaeon]